MLNINEPVNKVADLSIRCNILMRRKKAKREQEGNVYLFFFLVPCQYNKSMGK